MSDTPKVDPGRNSEGDPFDADTGFYGLDHNKDREAELGKQFPSGTVAAKPTDPGPPRDPALPPENGRRASFDPNTGAVHGSGSSAGGGNPGEDFDSDSAGGEGYPIDGGEGGVKNGDVDLGPPHFKE
eukprot:TRINITY_DN3488_c0_g1_i1.p1 TRINITY_DN3488_c0_g1~~TRINITY_DN3488_c0_g1_i1.p1  ORF type:complete len:128 (-),score=17.53 TRINITY_DN3488_c0_g1_i1:303-686(-)